MRAICRFWPGAHRPEAWPRPMSSLPRPAPLIRLSVLTTWGQFWPGAAGVSDPVFYAYAYPEPNGFAQAPASPAPASYDAGFGEFLLPYAAVRTSRDPDGALMGFLQSTYEAAAELGRWDRASVETAGRAR